MHKPKHRLKIYRSGLHLTLTIFFVVLPFIFLLVFSHLSNIARTVLFGNLAVSFSRLLIAYFIAVILAWILGVSFFRGKRAFWALPAFDVLQSFPTFATLPLAVYFWGASNFTIIFFLILTVIWPMLFSIIGSLRMIKQDWQEAVEMSGISGTMYVKKFIFPVSVPGLITGSLIGLGEGWEALIATEIVVESKIGLGSFFQTYASNPTITFLGILGFLLVIFSINKLIWTPLLDWSHGKLED
jgi:ABC-type nitrate/sulfonate/bicarbonate transport system permease component